MATKQYEIRYGTGNKIKSVFTDDYLQAERIFDKITAFANAHQLTWKIALWNDGYLVKSKINDFIFNC